MAKELRSHQIPHDSPEYDEAWAKDVIAAIGKREARKILADYQVIANNKRVPKSDRKLAEERAKTLGKFL